MQRKKRPHPHPPRLLSSERHTWHITLYYTASNWHLLLVSAPWYWISEVVKGSLFQSIRAISFFFSLPKKFNANQSRMPNQSKMGCQLELSVCLPIYCICLSTVLHIFAKISYWGLCFLLTWMATRWSFLVICWWFANLWLLKSRNLKTLLGSSGWGSCAPYRQRAEWLTCQGMEDCVKCKASVTFQPKRCLWDRNHKWHLLGNIPPRSSPRCEDHGEASASVARSPWSWERKGCL